MASNRTQEATPPHVILNFSQITQNKTEEKDQMPKKKVNIMKKNGLQFWGDQT